MKRLFQGSVGLTLFMIGVMLLTACGAGPTVEAQSPQAAPAREECHLTAPGLARTFAAQCTTLTVFEDPSAQLGRTIDLNIAVLPAISRNPAPDPLFLLAGGPGQAATEAFLGALPTLRQVNQDREIVLVDQRGTGTSNQLQCPNPEETTALTSAALQDWAADCLAQMDADPQFYTTSIAMDDLDQVRAALGYEQINLLGVSYGTRAALTYLRQHPDRVRTIILDGIVPQDLAIGSTMAADAQRAVQIMFERCAADPACNDAFPDLEAVFNALLSDLERQPVDVILPDPFTGVPITTQLTRDVVAITVQSLSYAPESVALLPLLLYTAQVDGDYKPLAAQMLMISNQLVDNVSIGMRFAVMCAEDVPFYLADAALTDGTYAGTLFVEQFAQACAAWPRGAVPADFKEPVGSEAPALLLSGEADPVTPPAYGNQVAATFPNSLHLVAPSQGHNVFMRGCMPDIVTDFIEQGSVDELETECISGLQATPFFTSFTGPQP
ncbi:MAG: alpha/beta hydrolase [Chloroflexales bacterium]|nr:alpha/beta hydrolase [Chloroflexales bacterium]